MRDGPSKAILGAVAAVLMAGACLGGWIVDGSPSLWIGAAVVTPADEYTYPVFWIPLGEYWTDFELKADTNNFATSKKCYFVQSHKFSTSGYGDTNVSVHFTDNFAPESMQWRKATNGVAIFNQVYNTASSKVSYAVVQPSHDCQIAWGDWMSRTNNRLVWSFIRYDGINLDDHWSPIVPMEWRAARVVP